MQKPRGSWLVDWVKFYHLAGKKSSQRPNYLQYIVLQSFVRVCRGVVIRLHSEGMGKLTKTLALRTSEELKRRLYEQAAREDRSANFLALRYIDAGLKKAEKSNQKTKKV